MPISGPPCSECGRGSILVANTIVYGKDVKWQGNVWVCEDFPRCDTYIPASSYGPTPDAIGTMAGPRLRRLRGAILEAVDDSLKSESTCGRLGRRMLYNRISKDLGWSGRFNVHALTVDKCLEVLAVIKPGFNETPRETREYREWLKD